MGKRSHFFTSLSFAGVGAVVLVGGCGTGAGTPTGAAEQVGVADEQLTAAQCEYFDVNGKVRICHKTNSTTHPYTVLKVSEQACITAHSQHADDYVAVGDPTCQGGGCLPLLAPCDATLPCCSGKSCILGLCVATCVPTTCKAQGAICGTIPDGCGDTLACSACADGGGTCASDNTCTCPPVEGYYPPCASNEWDEAAQACELTFAAAGTVCFPGATCDGAGRCTSGSTTPLY